MIFEVRAMNFNNRNSVPLQLIIITLSLVFLPGIACDPDIKQLGPQGFQADPTFDPTGVENFQLSYSFRNDQSETELASQGIAGSDGAFLGTCGTSGSNCICDFFTDEDGNGLVSSDDLASTYNSDGNIVYCTIPASVTDPSTMTHMRIRDRASTRFTDIIKITSQTQEEALGSAGDPLTIQDVLGDLQAVRVRKVFEYRCFLNYLFKAGTTEASFSCAQNADFRVVQVPYHFYLFADNIQNNFSSRIPDALHSDGSGTLCGAVIKSIDCTTGADGPTNPNALTLAFGLFAQNSGVFTKPVLLTNAPSRLAGTNSVFGFAAEVDDSSRCPPLFEKRESFVQQPADNGDTATFTNTNVDGDLVDTRILPQGTVFDMAVVQYSGGSCDATNVCTAPNFDLDNGAVATTVVTPRADTYVSNNDTVCVIQSSALSGL